MDDLPKAAEFIGEAGLKTAVDALLSLAESGSDEEVRLHAAEALLNWGARSPWHEFSDAVPEPEA